MKAIRISDYGGPEALEHLDVPVPRPGEGEVLVRIHSAGVCKPDILVRTGAYKWKPPLPTVIGEEGAGVIEELGAGVEGLAVGDQVLVSYAPVGCYAEYAVATTHNIMKLPAALDLELAVHLPNYISAYALLTDAPRGVDVDALYVNGAAGGVGVAIVTVARARGARVIAGASNEEKCAFLRAHGANDTINYGVQQVAPEVLKLTQGRGVPLILDHLVGPRFTDNLEMLAPLGMIVSFNALLGFPEDDLFAAMRANLAKSPAVRCFSGRVYEQFPARLREIQAEVLKMFVEGRIDPPVFQVMPLAEAQRAHELMDSGKVLGKIILKP